MRRLRDLFVREGAGGSEALQVFLDSFSFTDIPPEEKFVTLKLTTTVEVIDSPTFTMRRLSYVVAIERACAELSEKARLRRWFFIPVWEGTPAAEMPGIRCPRDGTTFAAVMDVCRIRESESFLEYNERPTRSVDYEGRAKAVQRRTAFAAAYVLGIRQ